MLCLKIDAPTEFTPGDNYRWLSNKEIIPPAKGRTLQCSQGPCLCAPFLFSEGWPRAGSPVGRQRGVGHQFPKQSCSQMLWILFTRFSTITCFAYCCLLDVLELCRPWCSPAYGMLAIRSLNFVLLNSWRCIEVSTGESDRWEIRHVSK